MSHTAIAGTVPPHLDSASGGPERTDTAGGSLRPRPAPEESIAPQTPANREPRRVPLHLLAALCVAILLVVIVGAFGGQTYRGVQEILRTVAFDETRYIRDALGAKVQGIIEPAESQLALLAHSDLPRAKTLADRLAELPLIMDALERNQLVDASFVGYPN